MLFSAPGCLCFINVFISELIMDRYKEDNNSENTSISEHNTRNDDDVEQISTITGSLSEAEDRKSLSHFYSFIFMITYNT